MWWWGGGNGWRLDACAGVQALATIGMTHEPSDTHRVRPRLGGNDVVHMLLLMVLLDM